MTLTLGTGAAFAADTKAQDPGITKSQSFAVTPPISCSIMPDPDIYAPYAAFGITVSDDGTKLLYDGRPVRQFVDEEADAWAFYMDEDGSGNFSVARNSGGEITGIESISEQKAREYYELFFAEELNGAFPQAQDIEEVRENVRVGPNKYEKYRPFGVTYSETDAALYFKGQRVKFLIDQASGEEAGQ
jgi:hypothetical protein